MRLFRQHGGLKGWVRNRLIGPGMAAWSMFVGLLSGTRIDYRGELGRVDDNTVVSSGRDWLWKQTLYCRLIVERKSGRQQGQTQWQEVDDHPLGWAWENGPHYDHTVVQHALLTALLVDGNAFLEKVRSLSGRVVGFAFLPTSDVEVCSDKGNPDGALLITHYEYSPPGAGVVRAIETAEMVHLRWGMDVQQMGLGLSPLKAALREIYGENTASTITTALLKNGGHMGLLFSPKDGKAGDMTPAQKEEWERRLKRQSQGDLAGTPMMAPFPIEVNPVGQSPDDLALSDTRLIQVSRICACLGIDPMVLGLPSSNGGTYDNYEQAVEAAFENTILPILKFVAVQITHQCLWVDFGADQKVRVGWDTSEVPALADDLDKLALRAKTLFESNLGTLDECRAVIKWDPAKEGGDLYARDLMAAAFAGPLDSVKARALARRLIEEESGADAD